MADQNITALPAVTTPESSDQLLLVGATEEKLIDYDKLADAILGKIASKNFALDQGNKTLLQALNELNSNRSISILKEVPGGDKILFFYTGSSSVVLNEKGSRIPSWSFCVYLPFSANGDGALLAIGGTTLGYAFRSSGVWEEFIEK